MLKSVGNAVVSSLILLCPAGRVNSLANGASRIRWEGEYKKSRGLAACITLFVETDLNDKRCP